ncbi:MAG: sugar phosphate isomerase/epimerase [Candidatus Azobacteroides sp.]|nr:sugar phosphate isomerase/epimerase [Candidatus Azobacteroides sp.]
MDRRQFIKSAAITTAMIVGGVNATTSFAASLTKSTPKIRWSMGWILWRDYKGSAIPLSEAVQNLSDLGLDGIEFSPRKDELAKFGFTRESFRDLLAEKKLLLSGNYFGGDFHNPQKHDEILEAFKNTVENVKFYGAKNIIIGPPGRGNWSDGQHAASQDNILVVDKIKAMAPFLNELGKIAMDSGVEIGLHPHLNTIVESPAEIDLIMSLTDPKYVGMAPDTGHIQLGGGNPLEIIKKYKERINYFHLKDVKGVFNRPNFEPNITEMGQGEVDFPSIMKFLKKIKFTGWLNVEQDFTTMTPYESAAESMKYLTGKMKPIYT